MRMAWALSAGDDENRPAFAGEIERVDPQKLGRGADGDSTAGCGLPR